MPMPWCARALPATFWRSTRSAAACGCPASSGRGIRRPTARGYRRTSGAELAEDAGDDPRGVAVRCENRELRVDEDVLPPEQGPALGKQVGLEEPGLLAPGSAVGRVAGVALSLEAVERVQGGAARQIGDRRGESRRLRGGIRP